MALHLNFLLFSSAILLLLGAANSDNRRTPLILPLSLFSRNSSFPDRYHQRRHLHSSQLHNKPSARMRLYDDLLTNGYYTTRLYIGTPPQEFALIVDTGSTVTYVPCSNCVQCGNHQDPRFKPELSSTYQPLKCNDQCNCDSEGKQCTYERRYAEMSSSSGVLGNDIVSFGNESALSPQLAEFGCETEETGDLYNQRADGIMGLGRGRISIVNQLVEKGVVDDAFSLCYGGMGIGGGAMILGRVPPPPNMVFSPSDPHRSPYYNIELKEIHVAGKPLKLNPNTFNGKHGTVLDSGTTYAYLPAKAFVAFKDAIMKSLDSLKQIDGPDPNYEDICFSGAGGDVTRLSESFPEVDMVFRNKQKLALAPENYLFRHSKVPGAYCLGIFKNENDETTLLGGILVRNTLVTYDREKNKIGFWKTNCSELGKRLQDSGAPAPAPANVVPQKNESSSALPPSMPPNGSSESIFSGKFNVGLITFDMSFNSNKKPNFTELAQLIASELGIDASQVKLLNFTSQGNHSLIKWAISPAKSENFISNSTAVSIIGQLKDHHVQLPDRFGSYELVEWKIEPQKKQTWWEDHGLVVVAAVVVTVVLCLSMFGIWFVWRNNRDGYKAVDSSVPEQELQLQPL